MTSISDDVEYLENLIPEWWKSHDTVLIVGRILDKQGIISDPWNFMEKPRAYQSLINDFVSEQRNG